MQRIADGHYRHKTHDFKKVQGGWVIDDNHEDKHPKVDDCMAVVNDRIRNNSIAQVETVRESRSSTAPALNEGDLIKVPEAASIAQVGNFVRSHNHPTRGELVEYRSRVDQCMYVAPRSGVVVIQRPA